MLKTIFSGLSAMWLAACSPVNLLNAMVPNHGFTAHRDIAYGDLTRQTLDIYLPTQRAADGNSVVVFFYGGGWEGGDKKDYKFVGEALSSHGITVVIPDYRVYPEVVFPDFVDDGAAAVAWIHANIQRYTGDNQQLFIAGHSAGAHIASLLALNPDYLKKYALTPDIIRGIIGLAGPYDFLPLKSDTLKTIFGPEDQRWQSQPINYVRGDNPPMLLMVGERDLTVWPRNSYRLADKLTEQGGEVTLLKFPDYGHVSMVAKLAKPLRGNGELLQPILAFIDKHRL
ncbi:MAG: alpha/beta hydrolase [Methylophaga sp.]|nr:alpha/beta hydrolase [Methylophaga sp.]